MAEVCPNLKPMHEWIQEPDEKKCRSCLLGPLVQWYRDELVEKGHTDLSVELTSVVEKEDFSEAELCRELDEVKDKVEEPLRQRLMEFDCSIQSFNPEEQPSD